MLAYCIHQFAEPLGGLDLNLCGNRESYGEQQSGDFVNAFQFSTWRIPKDETETMLTGTNKPKFVYLNTPNRALNKEQANRSSWNLQPDFVRKLTNHVKEGKIDHAIVIAPLDSSRYVNNTEIHLYFHRRWQHELLSSSLICLTQN